MNEMLKSLSVQAKAGLIAGVVLILSIAIGVGVWAYRPDYQVLFSDMSAADAASMTAELDKMKVPYQLADGGNTIVVPREAVYKTRLKLMGKDLPLHGAVGFEVFNNADFGMTEFVQKVNYQRALQGELTRTILSIDDIQSARVHLATPDHGLFKKEATKSKASVTLVMKRGRQLDADQIAGIQRLVAASVPDIAAADVTVLDQRGVALTRQASSGAGEAGGEVVGSQLDSKRNTEEYLTRKLTRILDNAFGSGEAVATVDVALNLNQDRVTTEEVLPSKSASADGEQTGVVVRERQTMHDNASSLGVAAAGHEGQSNGITSTESEYQVGRRVEQTVVAPGATRRLTVAVMVKHALDEAQIEKIKEVVSLAVGLDPQRGDAVVVSSMAQGAAASGEASVPEQMVGKGDVAEAGKATQQAAGNLTHWVTGILAVCLVLVISLTLLRLAGRPSKLAMQPRLTQAERDKILHDVRQWMSKSTTRIESVKGEQ